MQLFLQWPQRWYLLQICTLWQSIGSCKLVLNPGLDIAHIWLFRLGAWFILVVVVGFLMDLLTATNWVGHWPAMAPCCSAPMILARSYGHLCGVTAGKLLLGPHVTFSSLAESLIGQYFATFMSSKGFSYSCNGIVASEFSWFSNQRVSTACFSCMR